MKFCLASTSPRRRELFQQIAEEFDVISPDIEEREYPEKTRRMKCVRRAKDKCIAAVNKIKDDNVVVIASDTLVDFNGYVLDKPKDEAEAYRMIKNLSGTSHWVHTAVSVYKEGMMYSFCADTEVFFTKVPDDAITRYVKTSEPYDKAGGYAIQGAMGGYIYKINGEYDTVVGLPVEKLRRLLVYLCA